MVYGIVLAGGSGKRVGAETPKQYIEINGKPLLYYTLRAFEESEVDRICIVADEEHLQFVVSEIVDKYRLNKVIRVCQGGEERFDSVRHGLDDLKSLAGDDDIVLIHDGARPFIKREEINLFLEEVRKNGAAVAAMPVKDTIKISDSEGFVTATTVRANTWQIQTPQGFRYELIYAAYEKAGNMAWRLPDSEEKIVPAGKLFTDDSMVIEAVFPQQKIKLVKTSYENIKITTPEDLDVAKARLK